MAIASITRWGNSSGVRIPSAYLRQLSLSNGDKVEITCNENTITLQKTKEKSKVEQYLEAFYGLPFEEACKQANKDLAGEELVNWGDDVGEEIL